ncbi:MAG: hypothetical protein Fur0037_18370 [Planctomycetota bacterium]
MKIAWIAFVRGSRSLVPAVLAAVGLCLIGGVLEPGTLAPWLHAGLFSILLLATLGAIRFWPAFARNSGGGQWVDRMHRGPTRGCFAVSLGFLGAAAAGCAAAGAFVGIAWEMPAPRAFVQARRVDSPGRPDVAEFALPRSLACGRILLRPVAYLPAGGPEPARLSVFADGQQISSGSSEIRGNGDLIALEFSARSIARISIARISGNIPIEFPPGSVVAVSADERSTVWNAILASCSHLPAAFMALQLAALLGRFCGPPTCLFAASMLLVLGALARRAPGPVAVEKALRGEWLLADPGWIQASIPFLAAGLAAMMLSVRRRIRGSR